MRLSQILKFGLLVVGAVACAWFVIGRARATGPVARTSGPQAASSPREEGLLLRVKILEDAVKALESTSRELRTDLNSIKVKDIKFFEATASNDTIKQSSTIQLAFPERVDYVAIESLVNDGHDMHACNVTRRLDDKTFEVQFLSARPEGVRWIPVVKFIGVQIAR